jgi:hypothetical protein
MNNSNQSLNPVDNEVIVDRLSALLDATANLGSPNGAERD